METIIEDDDPLEPVELAQLILPASLSSRIGFLDVIKQDNGLIRSSDCSKQKTVSAEMTLLSRPYCMAESSRPKHTAYWVSTSLAL